MSRLAYFLIIFFAIAFWASCRKDFEYVPSSGNLQFSKDTVYLDTIFSNIGSSTYALKVYNKTGIDLEIPSIHLREGQNSPFRLNVDGSAGKSFTNIPIFAGDSLFIFIETTVDAAQVNSASMLFTDAIQFDNGANLQEVQLVTLVKDAIFLYPKTTPNGTKETLLLGTDIAGNDIIVNGFVLPQDQMQFTNEKAYVIYGYAAVPENTTLDIQAGARVFFHKNSGIWVQPKASIHINGALSTDSLLLEKEVIFEGDRLEPNYANVAGQWGTLWLASGSTDNLIDHLTLKNATVGVFVEGDGILDTPTLRIKNTRIYNSSNSNLWGRSAFIEAENLVLGNAGSSSLYCNLGGNYSFVHTTIANYWTDTFRSGPALRIDNSMVLSTGENLSGDLTKAHFVNSIIAGNNNVELSLISNGSNTFLYSFTDCSMRFEDNTGQFQGNAHYEFQNTEYYNRLYLNESPGFINPSRNNFRLVQGSSAMGKAQLEAAQLVPLDILGRDRTPIPDLGAFQSTEN